MTFSVVQNIHYYYILFNELLNCQSENLGNFVITTEKEGDYNKEEWYRLDLKSKKLIQSGIDIQMRVNVQVLYGPVEVQE